MRILVISLFLIGLISQFSSKSLLKLKKQGSSSNSATLTVEGSGTDSSPTDLIKISISIVTDDLSAAIALQKNTQASNSLSSSLASLNIPTANITTTSFSIQPQYKYSYNPTTGSYESIFEGYRVYNSLQITLSDLIIAGQVLDAASQIKDIDVNGINFYLSNGAQNSLTDTLITQAVQDALNQATLTVNAANSKIIGVQSVNFLTRAPTPIYRPQYGPVAEAAVSDSVAPTIYNGEQSNTVKCTIVFYISSR